MMLSNCSSTSTKKVILKEDEETKEKREIIRKDVERIPQAYNKECRDLVAPLSKQLKDILINAQVNKEIHDDCKERMNGLLQLLEDREMF